LVEVLRSDFTDDKTVIEAADAIEALLRECGEWRASYEAANNSRKAAEAEALRLRDALEFVADYMRDSCVMPDAVCEAVDRALGRKR
jgi:hypothetical protein